MPYQVGHYCSYWMHGHNSHYELRSVEIAKEEGVILFCSAPHTMQDSQPLDCTVFGPLKRHWSEVCHQHRQCNPGVVISKLKFSALFSQAWLMALTPGNIVTGFRKCGIYPFDRQVIPWLMKLLQSLRNHLLLMIH